ncbi:MAG: hypothetical protein ACP5E3_00950 [Bacteroidales bacterium]
MKKMLLAFTIFLWTLPFYARKEYLPTLDDLEHFYTTKTYVVLEASPLSDYNFEIKEVMERIWDITDFEFIEQDEFPKKSQNPNASFLYTSLVTFERDRTDSRYVFIHLSLGGDNLSIDDLRDLASIPLGYAGVDPENYIYKLGILLQFMQDHLRLITEKPEIISKNIFKHYNDNIQSAQQKVVYFVEDELSREIGTAARIKQYYPYRFKIVTREEIRQAIINKNEDVVFLHKVGPQGKKFKARCYKILIGAGDAKFYYFDYHMVKDKKPDGFLKSDLKKLAK